MSNDGLIQQNAWDQSWKQDGEGSRVSATFHVFPELDEAESARQGRPWYVDKEYVRILCSGEPTSIVDRCASELDKERFAKAYQQFKAGDQQIGQGTPLAMWPPLGPAECETLKARQVFTVEQLAALPDVSAAGLGMLRRRVQEARDWLAAAAKAAPITEMRAELEGRDQKIAAMGEEMAALKAQLAELSARAPEKGERARR